MHVNPGQQVFYHLAWEQTATAPSSAAIRFGKLRDRGPKGRRRHHDGHHQAHGRDQKDVGSTRAPSDHYHDRHRFFADACSKLKSQMLTDGCVYFDGAASSARRALPDPDGSLLQHD
jgi:hypothetical protein